MKILIGCEYSGIVRDAFIKKGHNAISCDILETEQSGPHYKGDIFDIINNDFDMLIAFPPCTYLSSAGLHLCQIDKYGSKAIERIKKRHLATEFFLNLWDCGIPKICLENPVGFISHSVLKQTQIIHPFYFGERQMKRTALWLKNLPPLIHSHQDNLFEQKTHTKKPDPERIEIRKETGKIKNRYFTDCFVGNSRLKTQHEKSKTFQSIADAMAEQWG